MNKSENDRINKSPNRNEKSHNNSNAIRTSIDEVEKLSNVKYKKEYEISGSTNYFLLEIKNYLCEDKNNKNPLALVDSFTSEVRTEARDYLSNQFLYRNFQSYYYDDLTYLIHLDYLIPYLFIEVFPQDKLVANYQEKCSSIYFLLDGGLDILYPKNLALFLTPQDYLMYLSYLKKSNQINLLNMVIEANESDAIFKNIELSNNSQTLTNRGNLDVNKNDYHSDLKNRNNNNHSKHKNQNNSNSINNNEVEQRKAYKFCLGQINQFIKIKKDIKLQYKKFILNTLKRLRDNLNNSRKIKELFKAPSINLDKDKNLIDDKNSSSNFSKKFVKMKTMNVNSRNINFNNSLENDNYLKNLSKVHKNSLLKMNLSIKNLQNKFNIYNPSSPEIKIKSDKNKYFNSNEINIQDDTNINQTDISKSPSKDIKCKYTFEEEELLDNIQDHKIFKKENYNLVKKFVNDNYINFNTVMLKITTQDYFYKSFNNFYVLNSNHLDKKQRVINVRLRINNCDCKEIKKNIKFDDDEKNHSFNNKNNYIKLNFKIYLDKLDEKIFKLKNSNSRKKTKKNISFNDLTDDKLKTIEKNQTSNNIPECILKRLHKQDRLKEQEQESYKLRIIDDISSSEYVKKFSVLNSNIFGFFHSHYFAQNESILKNSHPETDSLNKQQPTKANNLFSNALNRRREVVPVSFDIYNENLTDSEEENEQRNMTFNKEKKIDEADPNEIKKFINKVKERNSIYKYPFEIFEFSFLKTLKKGDIIGNPNDKLKVYPVYITSKDCYILKIEKKIFEETLNEINNSNIFRAFSHFTFCPVFKDLSKVSFYKLIFKSINFKGFHKNQIVINEGDDVNDLFFVKEGSFIIKIKKSILEINEILKKLLNRSTCENEDVEQDKIIGTRCINNFLINSI